MVCLYFTWSSSCNKTISSSWEFELVFYCYDRTPLPKSTLEWLVHLKVFQVILHRWGTSEQKPGFGYWSRSHETTLLPGLVHGFSSLCALNDILYHLSWEPRASTGSSRLAPPHCINNLKTLQNWLQTIWRKHFLNWGSSTHMTLTYSKLIDRKKKEKRGTAPKLDFLELLFRYILLPPPVRAARANDVVNLFQAFTQKSLSI